MRSFKIANPKLEEAVIVGHGVLLELVKHVGKSNILTGQYFVVEKLGNEVPESVELQKGHVILLQPVLSINEALQREHLTGVVFADQGKRQFVILSSFTWITMHYMPSEMQYVDPDKLIVMPKSEIIQVEKKIDPDVEKLLYPEKGLPN